MSEVLTVYLRNERVGRLWLENRRFAFQYDEAWLASSHALPLSLALPLRAVIYADDTARPFFANLLPEPPPLMFINDECTQIVNISQ